MKRKHKQYSRPKRAYDKARILDEAKIKEEYGLKNKREIWKAEARVKVIREQAKKLISSKPEQQKKFFEQLKRIGINVNSLAEALSISKKDYLNRRLQTVVFNQKLAPTIKTARQLIAHKKIIVNNQIVDIPSYIVPIEFENKISLKKSKPKNLKENANEIKEQTEGDGE